MARQVQVPGAGMIALGVFILGFVLLMLAGYSFVAALFFALVVAVAVAIFFLLAGQRTRRNQIPAAGPSAEPRSAAAARPSAGPPVPEPAPSGPRPAPAPEPASDAALRRAPAPTPEPASGGAPPSGAGVGTEPPRLAAPREGGADDLKRIKGIGPKIEEALNGIGIHHLDQIAAWGPAEVAWIDSHLEDLRGRIGRDDWIGQARHLVEDEKGSPSSVDGVHD